MGPVVNHINSVFVPDKIGSGYNGEVGYDLLSNGKSGNGTFYIGTLELIARIGNPHHTPLGT
jgi:hypothetical protein